MEQFWGILSGCGRALLVGCVFGAALHYMERRRILRGFCSGAGCAAAGLCVNLFSDWLLYQAVGFLRHPLFALLAGLSLTALAAAVVSAAGLLPAVVRKRRWVRRKFRREGKNLPLSEVRQHRLSHAA